MVSDQEIAESLGALFRDNPPNSFTTLNEVVIHLQSRLGYDLSNKIDFIHAQINLIFSGSHPHPPPPPPPQQQVSNLAHHPQHHHANPIFRAAPSHYHPQQPRGPVFRGNATEINFAQPGHQSLVATPSHLGPEVPVKEGPPVKPKRRGGPGGLNKLCGVSPELEAVVGEPAMPRTKIVKQLWAYIRENNLQDPSNKRKIICNDKLRILFDTDCTDMFQMNKLLSKHILPLDPSKDPASKAKKQKVEEAPQPDVVNPEADPSVKPEAILANPEAIVANPEAVVANPEAVVANPEAVVANPEAIVANPEAVVVNPEAVVANPEPVIISEALVKFFGTSEKEMPQVEVFQRLSEYIKVQGLEDTLNSTVLCDSKLQDLFGCENIPAAEMYDVLARNHLFQRS